MGIEEIIIKKRDGGELSEFEINSFIENVVKGKMSDSQIGAMLMAIFIKGLTKMETLTLTKAMICSGEVLRWRSEWNNITADKHSTGGVGDKISIVLAPALAACGLKVPMLSGRSLAFTGGTLDKLESIPGFNVNLTKSDLEKCLNCAGCFISSTTDDICPGDRILYKKRNETSTVNNINLITSSVISKKAVEGIKNLVIDLKVGRGSFMKDIEMAKKLAEHLMYVSNNLGIKTKVFLTRMDYPLGRAVGNSLEIIECVKLMKGDYIPHVQELVTTFGGTLLELSGKVFNTQEGIQMIEKSLKNGEALKFFHKMLIYQGVKEEFSKSLCYGSESESLLPTAQYKTDILASESGWIEEIDALTIGEVCKQLTNTLSTNTLDLSTGVYIKKIIGEPVKKDEPWLTVYHSTPIIDPNHKQLLEKSVTITKNKDNLKENKLNLILEVIESK